MNFELTPLPTYQTPVAEDPDFAPIANQPRMEIGFYQWLQNVMKRLSYSPTASFVNATDGKASANASSLVVTTEPLTTAVNAFYSLTLTNNQISAQTNLLVTISNGTNTASVPLLWSVVPANGTAAIRVKNVGAAAFNGTLQLNLLLF
jgi:hypothetical protein